MNKELKKTNRKIRELKRKVRKALGLRNTFGDRIIIEDEVLVYQGAKLLFKSKGHIVNQGLIALINFLSCADLSSTTLVPSNLWTAMTAGTIDVGTGTGVTTGTMTSLVTDEGTNPDVQSGETASPATGTYRVSWIATWNSGTLAAIDISELGIKLRIDGDALNAFGGTCAGTTLLFSRLSDSDGDFTTFTVNIAVPLTIEWRLTFTFA